MTYSSIRPGRLWLDTAGKPIQAHGFSVFWSESEKLWVWYGENKEKTDGKGTVWHWGVQYDSLSFIPRSHSCDKMSK